MVAGNANTNSHSGIDNNHNGTDNNHNGASDKISKSGTFLILLL